MTRGVTTGRTHRLLAIAAVLALLATVLAVSAPADAVAPKTCFGYTATIQGTDGDDVIVGTIAADVIHAGDGNDIVRGLSGADIICGGMGNDILLGHGGPDWLFGNDGDDVLAGSGGEDYLSGGHGNDRLNGGDLDDLLFGGPGDDQVTGLGGDDTIYGGPGADSINAGDGDDWANAGSGNDNVHGGNGNDTLLGAAGDDFLFGQDGDDSANGNSGNDICRSSETVLNCRYTFQLTVLHNNDGESNLLGDGDFGSIARFTSKVLAEKAAATSVLSDSAVNGAWLMLSSGDNFLAGAQFDASLANGIPYFDAVGMDFIGYDAVAIGNHDFDFTPDVLEDFIKSYSKTAPPYLSSNLDFSLEPGLDALYGPSPHMPGDPHRIAASAVIKKGNQYVGVVGATTPNITFISSPRDTIVDPDVAGAIQAEVDTLLGMGINKIVVISHLQDVDGDVALAAELTGVDIMIAGGGDELLANDSDLLIPGDGPPFAEYPILATDGDGKTVPVVTTSGQYFYLGKLVVEFDEAGEIVSWWGGPQRIVDSGFAGDGVVPDSRSASKVEAPVAAYVADLGSLVIGTSEVPLDGIRDNIRSIETNEGNLVADSQLWAATVLAPSFSLPTPDVALANGGGIRNDSIIPAGDITELDTYDIVPFGNVLTIVPDIPRSQFKEILENAVSRTQPGDTPGGTGRFAEIAGFSFTYDTSGTAQVLDGDGNVVTAGTRVTEVTLDDSTVIVTGGAVVAGPDITITIVNFLAGGGDEYPFRGAPFTLLGMTYQRALSDYIQGPLGGVITAVGYPVGGEGRITAV